MFDKVFAFFGGVTKFWAVVAAVMGSLEATDVIPAGAMDAVAKVIEAISAAGIVFGFRNAVDKIGSK